MRKPRAVYDDETPDRCTGAGELDDLPPRDHLLIGGARSVVGKTGVAAVDRKEGRIMSKGKILVVDDEEDILELLQYNLTKEGYDVDCVSSGEDAVKHAREVLPDLIVLDLMLPGLDGLDVYRKIKDDTRVSHIPIIMLTAKSEDADVVTGLELGADDYITKPFSPRVLLARLKAVLRRRRSVRVDSDEIISIHGITINPARHEVLVNGKPIQITATQFAILVFLSRRPGWVFSREQIINSVKGSDYPVTDRSVDVQIVGLRRCLGEVGHLIETVRGVGYRFKEPE
jgi:two-component system phosphate regulon response regulator PhoB